MHNALMSSQCNVFFLSCLRAIRVLQKNGHVPSDPALFKSYAEYGHFVDIRIAALEAVVDYTKGNALGKEMVVILEGNSTSQGHWLVRFSCMCNADTLFLNPL